MPDDFEAEQDFHILTTANKIARDKSRVARAKRFAESKADELRKQSEVLPTAQARPIDGSPRKTSFVKKGKKP
jgi:hypothetical protein